MSPCIKPEFNSRVQRAFPPPFVFDFLKRDDIESAFFDLLAGRFIILVNAGDATLVVGVIQVFQVPRGYLR